MNIKNIIIKFKELTITELLSIITAVALVVCVITQTYFYFRLDALWVMSLIPPSIYFFEIIKIIVIFIFSISLIFILEECYKKLTKRFRHKKKIRYIDSKSLQTILIKNRKNYECNFIGLVSVLTGLFALLFFNVTLLSNQSIVFISSAMTGFALILVTDKTLTKGLKFFVLALVLLMAAIATAETKYNQILQLPKVTLLDSSKSQLPFYLLEISKTNAVLLQRDKNGTNRFKIVDLNQIHSISHSDQP